MDSKDSKATVNATPPSIESPNDNNLPAYSDHSDHQTRRPSRRPGEDLMNSGDPSTAALRAWAEDKQKHVPGTDGSFVTGPMSMGVGAVSGGPMFLPRKEFIVDPPMHEVDRLKAEEEADLSGGEGEGSGKKSKRRGSVKEFFRRLSTRGREEKEEESSSGPVSVEK